ncbi:metallophosphoesterase [Bacillus solimangrovi]|uniref:Phosphoesterase n=1 Tax=Bacillus solimangrovi TaxID=1305675 RepID=A0A1E5LCX8_9BACI|nr:metallophosphoesterase [Bacillus solimangrovi]OEH91942.1 YfcE family phosphodiesterase [Bacillus solimangrovi]
MNVLIVSDNHGDEEILATLKERHHSDVDAFIHCGDSELPANEKSMEYFRSVRGNCDFDDKYVEERVESIDGVNCFITHGHLYNVKMSLMNIIYRAKEVGASIVCYGHSHIASVEEANGIVLINPGSIRLPRLRKDKTYAILSIEQSKKITVRYYTTEGTEVKEMSFETILE